MPQFVIERPIDGIGAASGSELQAIAQKSYGVLQELGPSIQWVHSYVTGDKIYCVYIAPDDELVREHAHAAAACRTRTCGARDTPSTSCADWR